VRISQYCERAHSSWRLWRGRVDHAIRDLQELLDGLTPVDEIADLSISRLRSLGAQLLTYVASNRSAIINYGKRYRARLRVASTLAESAVNSIVGNHRGVKQRIATMLGFKGFATAAITIAGIELMHRVRKGQFGLGRLGVQGRLAPAVWNARLQA
jgi:hypothetical protein